MKRSMFLAAGGFVAAIGVTAYGQADLNGDNVSLELWSSDTGSFGVNNVTVGAGEDTNFFGNQFVDFNAGVDGDRFTIRSTGNFSSIDGAGGRIEWRLTDLDFPGGPLIAVNIIEGFSDVSVINLTANSVTFEYEDIEIPADTYFQAQFVVPAPAGVALLGLGGLGGLVATRRRR